jgi:hypothetical protein
LLSSFLTSLNPHKPIIIQHQVINDFEKKYLVLRVCLNYGLSAGIVSVLTAFGAFGSTVVEAPA